MEADRQSPTAAAPKPYALPLTAACTRVLLLALLGAASTIALPACDGGGATASPFGSPAADAGVAATDGSSTPAPAADAAPPRADGQTAAAPFQCVPDPAVSCADQRTFFLLAQESRFGRDVWAGKYPFGSWPLYVVHWDGTAADRAYLLTPPSVPADATAIVAPLSQGLGALYRYDAKMADAVAAARRAGNDLFDFQFAIAGTDYSMMLITDEDQAKLEAGDYFWIDTLFHETFHAYQGRWTQVPGALQDIEGYPLSRDVVALSLLELRIAAAAYKAAAPTEHDRYLKMYLAARSQKMAIDPSPSKLVSNMDNAQEQGEGTALYVEVKTHLGFDPGFVAATYKLRLDEYMAYGPQSSRDLRDWLAFGMWYDTGSIVLFMMDNLGIPFVDGLEAGQTQYQLVRAHYGLSSADLDRILGEAKDEMGWSQIQNDAAKYVNLP